MKQTVTKYDFTQAFRDMNRDSNFSYAGLEALFDHLEEIEECCGEEFELDVIGLCGEFCEYDDIEEAIKKYGEEPEEFRENHTIIEFGEDGHVIVGY